MALPEQYGIFELQSLGAVAVIESTFASCNLLLRISSSAVRARERYLPNGVCHYLAAVGTSLPLGHWQLGRLVRVQHTLTQEALTVLCRKASRETESRMSQINLCLEVFWLDHNNKYK